MTVKELIAKLQALGPAAQDLRVAVCDEEYGWVEATCASNTDTFHLADYTPIISPIIPHEPGHIEHYVQIS